MTTTTSTTRPAPPSQVPELPADLAAGLRRLKLATVRPGHFKIDSRSAELDQWLRRLTV